MPADERPTKETLILRAKEIARSNGRPGLSQLEARQGGLSAQRAKDLFGGWNAFVRAAGLTPDDSRKRIDDDRLLREIRDACVKAGGVVSLTHVLGRHRRHQAPYRKRWGSWRGVLLALRDWCTANDPGFAYLAALPTPDGPALPKPVKNWPPPARRYGAPMHFRCVLHEPVNEPGVILLFGLLAQELGFGIESVHASFPDCEAKRRTGLDTWEKVRIEFEFESRNFKSHGHDPAGCDLIVCWAHTWPECPLEVLELRAEVEKRKGIPVPQVLPAWVRGCAPRPSSFEDRPRVRQTQAIME